MSVIESKKRLGFGLMRLPLLNPDNPANIDVEQVKQMVDTFLERGFTYFDTAWMYHSFQSENVVKEALVDRYPRDSYTLATKLHAGFIKTKEDRDKVFEEQRRKTGVEYFDYYLLHDIGTDHYEIYKNLDCFNWIQEKKATGLVRHIGFSFHDNAELLDRVLTEHPEFEFVQLQLNYLDWDDVSVQSRACYEVCRAHGKPVMVMEPIKGGTLATLPPAAAEALAQTCPDAPASYALRFAGGHEGVAMVLSGMGTTEQMAQNIKTFSPLEPLSEEELAGLARVVNVMHGQDVVACTACRYCVEGCPRRIDIPALFACLNAKRAYGDRGQAFYYNNVHTKGRGRASDCVRCGRCEHACPQHLPIRELLQDVAAEFEAPAE